MVHVERWLDFHEKTLKTLTSWCYLGEPWVPWVVLQHHGLELLHCTISLGFCHSWAMVSMSLTHARPENQTCETCCVFDTKKMSPEFQLCHGALDISRTCSHYLHFWNISALTTTSVKSPFAGRAAWIPIRDYDNLGTLFPNNELGVKTHQYLWSQNTNAKTSTNSGDLTHQ